MKTRFQNALVCLAAAAAAWSCGRAVAQEADEDRYLQAVRVFAENVLEHGRDTYGEKKTPLLVDGIHVDTLEPPIWKRDGQPWILSNLASQQNLFRTLDALSSATGDPRYRQAAVEATKYTFEHLQDPGGLLRWAGHTSYDALGDRVVSEAGQHELKHHYPYYDLMWQVDPDATKRLLEGIWQAHVVRWDVLDFNRHGSYGRQIKELWDHDYTGGRVPFEGKGLTFMMSGTDLVYAAAMLSRLAGDERPLLWAKRLARRYVDARHPVTGLGASNFSTRPDRRMQKQFPQFQGRFSEATVTDLYGARYTYCAICLLRLGETLGPSGKEFVQWGLEELTARAKHGYDEATKGFSATLIDGTRLSPADIRISGYVKPEWLAERPVDSRHFLAYALAYKLTRDDLTWRMTRSIAEALGLGVLSSEPGEPGAIDRKTANNDPLVLFGLLELHEATGDGAYLDAAKQVADNALATRFHQGFFVETKDHVYARFDDPTPLALLHLRAAMLGLARKPPAFWCGRGYFHCPYDGEGRTYDVRVIYTQTRSQTGKH